MRDLLIEPEALAKKTKETSRTVSLRVLERTYLGFEQIAEKYNTTANALIAKLADTYIENLSGDLSLGEKDINDSKKKNLVAYLNKLRINVMNIDDDVILDRDSKTYEYGWGWEDDIWKLSSLERVRYCLEKWDDLALQEHSNYFEFIDDCSRVYIVPTIKTEAKYYPGGPLIESGIEGGRLIIPYKKWPVVQHILKAFETKRNALKLDFELDDVAMYSIATIVDTKDERDDIIRELVKLLISYTEAQ